MPKMDGGRLWAVQRLMMVCRTHHTGRWWTERPTNHSEMDDEPRFRRTTFLSLCASLGVKKGSPSVTSSWEASNRGSARITYQTQPRLTHGNRRLHREDGRILVRLVLCLLGWWAMQTDCSSC